MRPMPPWTTGPFELLVHAQGHLAAGEDFDRRIALISFDNAIEVAIATYLTLNPLQRAGRTYQRADVERWLSNYPSKLDFLEAELAERKLPWTVEKSHIGWAHDHRNEQYHGGLKGTPEKRVLAVIREAALWVFSLLYDVPDVEQRLEQALLDAAPPAPNKRRKTYDTALDGTYGVIDLGDQSYYASELLFFTDYDAYVDIGRRLTARSSGAGSPDVPA